jgi:hypothetical protein
MVLLMLLLLGVELLLQHLQLLLQMSGLLLEGFQLDAVERCKG